MGKSKVKQTQYIPGGEAQQRFNETISRLMLGFIPALTLQQAPELLPLISPSIERGLAPVGTPVDIQQLGTDVLQRIQERAEATSQPMKEQIRQAQNILNYQISQLKQDIEHPMDNPFIQSVIDAERRRLTEETRRGIESLATGFQLAGMSTSSAMPEQARLLQERGLLQLQETVGKLLSQHFTQQIENRRQALEQLSKLPTEFLNIGQIQSYLQNLPYDIMRGIFTDLGQIFSMGTQGIVAGQVVTPSPFATVAGAMGGLLGGVGSVLGGIFGRR